MPAGDIDVFANIVVITFAADFLDHRAQQNEAVIAVLPATARLEFGSAIAIELHIVLQRVQFQPMRIKLRPKDVAGASGMR